jgi:hypothetical protein
MKAFWMSAVLLAWCASAFAFENIEADAVYNTAIKEEILKEFSQGLKMLKAQADGLGMEVREKDVKAFQMHMYEKALLMGKCVDKAITFKKTISNKILSDNYVQGCIEVHLKFIDWLHTAKSTPFLDICEMRALRYSFDGVNAPYDFLDFKEFIKNPVHVTDYVAMKECYDHPSETDKLLDR